MELLRQRGGLDVLSLGTFTIKLIKTSVNALWERWIGNAVNNGVSISYCYEIIACFAQEEKVAQLHYIQFKSFIFVSYSRNELNSNRISPYCAHAIQLSLYEQHAVMFIMSKKWNNSLSLLLNWPCCQQEWHVPLLHETFLLVSPQEKKKKKELLLNY